MRFCLEHVMLSIELIKKKYRIRKLKRTIEGLENEFT